VLTLALLLESLHVLLEQLLRLLHLRQHLPLLRIQTGGVQAARLLLQEAVATREALAAKAVSHHRLSAGQRLRVHRQLVGGGAGRGVLKLLRAYPHHLRGRGHGWLGLREL
jgi:hypothetical protein